MVYKMEHLGTVTLETERLLLRKCEIDDYKDSFKYCCSDPELARLQAFDAHENDQVTKRSFTEKANRYLVDPSFYEWAIVRKEDNQFMGEIALVHYNAEDNCIETGYHLGKAFRGKGYMQEALSEILRFAFENLNLDQVYALILNDNYSSQKVVKSNNLEYSGIIEDFTDEGESIDKYSMTKDRYFELKNKLHSNEFSKKL